MSPRKGRLFDMYKFKKDAKEYLRRWQKKNKLKLANNQRLRNILHPIRRRNSILKSKYGITIDQYYEIFRKQGRKCKLCGMKTHNRKSDFVVDHCHKTGRIRGILCFRCNSKLGMYRDDPKLLRKAADYLENL